MGKANAPDTQEKPRQFGGAKYGALTTIEGLHSQGIRARAERFSVQRVIAPALVCLVSTGWLSAILRSGLSAAVMPWFATLALGTAWLVGWDLTEPETQISFSGLLRKDDDGLKAWLSLAYFSASLLVFSFFLLVPGFEETKPLEPRQVIDIQLVSSKDYADHKELLPSTQPKLTVMKRLGEMSNAIGEQSKIPTPVKDQKPLKVEAKSKSKDRVVASVPRSSAGTRASAPAQRGRNEVGSVAKANASGAKTVQSKPPGFFIVARTPTEKTLDKAHLESQGTPTKVSAAPASASTSAVGGAPERASAGAAQQPQKSTTMKNFPWPQYMANNVQFVSSHAPSTPHASMDIQEVRPPELLEVTGNDGDSGPETWQQGGRSPGGKGARSPLSLYLKEMHQKLRNNWSPTAKTSRQAQILFRLARDGNAIAVKLITSSGDPAVDRSAIEAIAAASPFGALPKDYAPAYLDVKYTFSFHTNELIEAKNGAKFSLEDSN